MHGRGVYDGKTRGRYAGDFVRGEFTGYGVHTLPSGNRFEGIFEDWTPAGYGRWTHVGGAVTEGRSSASGLIGPGRIFWSNGNRYDGDTEHGAPHGFGVWKAANGDVYRGSFRHGEFDGEGELVYARPRDGRRSDRGQWTYGRFAPDEQAERRQSNERVERALYAQPALLEKALAELTPGDPSRVEMYLLAVAGDGQQEVFRREVEFVHKQFDAEFGTRGRSVALVNSRSTVDDRPMATVTSMRRALDAVASKMNREQDILFLFMTSHGSSTHEFSLGLQGMSLPSVTPKDLAQMLDASGIRWRVLVVSACYAGGFVDPLKNDHTLIITAARHDRRSFGCADANDFTYFGRAFFKEALPKSASFQAAFAEADRLVASWEGKHGVAAKRKGAQTDDGHDVANAGADAVPATRAETTPAKSAGDAAVVRDGDRTRDRVGDRVGDRARDRDDGRSLPQMSVAPPIAEHLAGWWRERQRR